VDRNVNVHYDDSGKVLKNLKPTGVTGMSSFDKDLQNLWKTHHEMDIDE